MDTTMLIPPKKLDLLNLTVKSHALKKKVCDFPFPSRDVTNQTLPGRE
jgi:hypothetical protein